MLKTEIFLLAALLSYALPCGATLSQGTADLVLGQDGFASNTVGLTDAVGIVPDYNYGYGGAVAIDQAHSRVYVADGDNNRVLFWNNMSSLADGQAADGVIGQASFTANIASDTAANLNIPCAVTVDASANLWVVDCNNNRVLRYPAPVTSGESADLVIGEPDFLSTAGGTSTSTVLSPEGAKFDPGGNLWVADAGNNRILRFPAPFSTGENADIVIGQDDFESDGTATDSASFSYPSGLAFDAAGDLWVADAGNARALEFQVPLSSGMDASLVLGQADFVSNGTNTSSTTLGAYAPGDVTLDSSGDVWLLDWGNNRALRYDVPLSSGMAASIVLGQQDFISNGSTATAAGLNAPVGIILDGSGDVWIQDLNNRVLRYPAPISSAESANLVLGQPNFTDAQANALGAGALQFPADVLIDAAHNRAFVADNGDNRVLVWNNLSGWANGQAADAVLGQANASDNMAAGETASGLSSPTGLAVDSSGNLWVADTNNARVVRFPAPFTTGMSADEAIGQPALNEASACSTHPTASCLSNTQHLAFDPSGNLWVSGDNRILRFPKPQTTGENADVVLGQADLDSSGAGLSAAQLQDPEQIAFDSAGNLWVADDYNNRALRYDVPFSTGMAASIVVGQSGFNTATRATTAAGIYNPTGLAIDGSGNLWLGDTGNERLLRYNAPLSSGMAASAVLGQSVFTSSASATSASGFQFPLGLAIDSSGNLWVADAQNNRVLEFKDAPTTGNVGAGGTVTLYQIARGTVTVTVPSGAFSQAVNLSISIPASYPSAGSSAGSLTPTGAGAELSLDAAVQPIKNVTVTLPYSASDVGAVDVSKLVVARYDPGDNVWVPYPSTVDPVNRLVTAQVNHFSTYQIMASAAGGSISGGVVFPNPFRPALGHTAVTFSNFPAGATLTIYTMLGEKVKDLTADGNGMASWDGKTRYGREAASGVYFVLAQSGGQHAIYKVAVQR